MPTKKDSTEPSEDRDYWPRKMRWPVDALREEIAADIAAAESQETVIEALKSYDAKREPLSSVSAGIHLSPGAEKVIHGHFKPKPLERGPWESPDSPLHYSDCFSLGTTTVFVSDPVVLKRIASVCRSLARKIEKAER